MPWSVARVAMLVAVASTFTLETAAVVLSHGVAPMAPAVIYAGYATVQAAAGGMVVWRYPRHRVGWLLVLAALFHAVVSDFGLAYGEQGAHHGWPATDLAQVLGWSAWIIAALGLTLLFLWFPRLAGRRPGPARALALGRRRRARPARVGPESAARLTARRSREPLCGGRDRVRVSS